MIFHLIIYINKLVIHSDQKNEHNISKWKNKMILLVYFLLVWLVSYPDLSYGIKRLDLNDLSQDTMGLR